MSSLIVTFDGVDFQSFHDAVLHSLEHHGLQEITLTARDDNQGQFTLSWTPRSTGIAGLLNRMASAEEERAWNAVEKAGGRVISDQKKPLSVDSMLRI